MINFYVDNLITESGKIGAFFKLFKSLAHELGSSPKVVRNIEDIVHVDATGNVTGNLHKLLNNEGVLKNIFNNDTVKYQAFMEKVAKSLENDNSIFNSTTRRLNPKKLINKIQELIKDDKEAANPSFTTDSIANKLEDKFRYLNNSRLSNAIEDHAQELQNGAIAAGGITGGGGLTYGAYKLTHPSTPTSTPEPTTPPTPIHNITPVSVTPPPPPLPPITRPPPPIDPPQDVDYDDLIRGGLAGAAGVALPYLAYKYLKHKKNKMDNFGS